MIYAGAAGLADAMSAARRELHPAGVLRKSPLKTDAADSLLDAFRDPEDSRSAVSRLLLHGDLILMSAVAVFAGAGDLIGERRAGGLNWLHANMHGRESRCLPSHHRQRPQKNSGAKKLSREFSMVAPCRRGASVPVAPFRVLSRWRQQSRVGLCRADHGLSDNSRNEFGGVGARSACRRVLENTKGAKRRPLPKSDTR